MRQQLRPSIESLETRNLLSSVSLGLIGNPVAGVHFVVDPIWPPVGAQIPRPVAGPIVSPVTGMPGTGVPTSPLQVSMTTNQASYTSGQKVTMTFTETNDTNAIVIVPIGPSIDGFSITNGSQTIWMSNSGSQSDVIYLERLAPGQSMSLTASWTATSAGTYSVHNQLAPGATTSFDVVASQAIVVLSRPPGR